MGFLLYKTVFNFWFLGTKPMEVYILELLKSMWTCVMGEAGSLGHMLTDRTRQCCLQLLLFLYGFFLFLFRAFFPIFQVTNRVKFMF